MVGKEELIKSLTELLENEDVEAIQEKVAELKGHYEALLVKGEQDDGAKVGAEAVKDPEPKEPVLDKETKTGSPPTESETDKEEDPKKEAISVDTVVEVVKAKAKEAGDEVMEIADVVSEAVEDVVEAVKDEVKEEIQDQKDKAEEKVDEAADDNLTDEESEEPVAIESAELQDDNDKQFKLLLDEFNKRRNDLRKQRAEEIKQNVAKAREVIAELKKLNAEEENISRSFNKLNELREIWKGIGNVPKDQYRDLQHEYSQELDVFFYNINIYKELRENDLKKNSGLKQALISDVKALSEEKNIRILDQKLREYQEQWHQIGPTLKEEWEELRDQFWGGIREAYHRVHEHYQKRREEQEGNLKTKQEMVEKIKAINEQEIKDHKAWRKATETVLEAQGEWRKIGFATKKDNERIWKEFRNVCDTFFAKKHEFYDALKGSNAESKTAKEKLIEQAEALKESTEWRDTTDKFKALQKQWQSSGVAAPKDDQRLWRKFRAACDHFFNHKKEHFASQDKKQAKDLKLKEALLKKMEGHKHSGKKQEDLAAIKAFQEEWKAIGHVPMKHKERVNKAYFGLLDGFFSALDMDQQEKAKIRFQSKLDGMSGGPNAGRSIQKEQNFIRGKKQELENELLQLENNMGMFFKHADDSNPLVREANKKLDKVKREIQKLVEQEKLLRQHAKQVQ